MSGKTREKVKPSPSLLGAAEEAVGVMALAILDLGKLDNAPVRNDVQWSLDASSKALADAVEWVRTFSKMVLAQQNKGMGNGVYDLSPINATCAECKDYALIISVPDDRSTGIAVCRTCSFPWPPRRRKAVAS